MRARRPRVPFLARLSLLIAAACNLAVAVVGPRQHLALELAGERAAALQAHPSPSSPQPHPHGKAPAHDESTCLLCHSLTAAALPAAGSGVLLTGSVAILEATEPASVHGRTSVHPTRARAPPAAIV